MSHPTPNLPSTQQFAVPHTPDTSRLLPGTSTAASASSTNPLQPLPSSGSLPELSRSPFAAGSLSSSTSASVPFSWSPSPQHLFHPLPGPTHPTPSIDITASQGSMMPSPYHPPPVRPTTSTVIRPAAKRKSEGTSARGSSLARRKRGRDSVGATGESQQDEGSQSASSRGYARWDTRRDDGLTVEACLVQWMSRDGNWRKWKDAKSTGEKDKCLRAINAHVTAESFVERSRDSIVAKFKALEDSYKKALLWQHSTGSGSYSTAPDDEDDGRSPYTRELEKRCKYWDQLQLAFGERAGMMPRRIYSSMESEAMREADLDLRRLLGLSRFEDEETGDEGEGQPGQSSEQRGEENRTTGTVSAADTSRHSDRTQGSRAESSASSSRSQRNTIIPKDVLATYLNEKKEAERRNLKLLEREDVRKQRMMNLEEQKYRYSQQLQRAEIIATYLKAGLNVQEATKMYEDGKQEAERSASQTTSQGLALAGNGHDEHQENPNGTDDVYSE